MVYSINSQNPEVVFELPDEYNAILSPGKYKFKLWGAAGGSTEDSNAGKGGFISATVKLLQETNAFIFVGGKGNVDRNECASTSMSTYHNVSGGFNGGGHTWTAFWGGSGGGASDIRFFNDSLTERVIVAGGGGGAAFESTGDDGGYPVGTDASISAVGHERSLGRFGNQTHGGDLKECSLGECILSDNTFIRSGFTNSYGSFGVGGNAIGRHCGGGGGGGGWFGGAGNYNAGGGGGGSSYISSSFNLLSHYTGVNDGNGKVIITFISSIKLTCKSKMSITFFTMIYVLLFLNC